MKNSKLILSVRKFLSVLFLAFPLLVMGGNLFPVPSIKVGSAKISGHIDTTLFPAQVTGMAYRVTIFNPVTGNAVYESKVDKNGMFNIDVPLECNVAFGSLNLFVNDEYYQSVFIGLDQVTELKLNIILDGSGGMKTDMQGGLNLTPSEGDKIIKSTMIFDEHYTWGNYYKMSPDEFVKYELEVSLKDRIKAAIDSLELSNRVVAYLTDSYQLRYAQGRLFHYKKTVEESYRGTYEHDKEASSYKALEPDKGYYSFLREFNLNNPQYLYCYTYADFMKAFLQIKAFHIPEIGNTPVRQWIDGVKTEIKEVVGFDSGLFYDMLAATAYDLQLSDKNEPLSDMQIIHIKDYYSGNNKDFASILIKQNDTLKNKLDSSRNLEINETPAVEKENLMDAIVSKYKGKVVLVDFWATWCSPCQAAIKSMEVLKREFKNKEIAFVYITGSTSPKETWRNQVKIIGGEHYYFTKEEWKHVTGSLGFETIPSYLIYDANGALVHKITGFLGTEEIRGILKNLLPD